MEEKAKKIEVFLANEQLKIDRAEYLLDQIKNTPWYRLIRKYHLTRMYHEVVMSFEMIDENYRLRLPKIWPTSTPT